MAAAMAGLTVGNPVATIIHETIQRHTNDYNTTGAITPAKYRLRFKFDDKEFSTIFEITEDEQLTNGCIDLTGFASLNSAISSNTPTKNCFTPNLSNRESLPTGITQTDILQVLSTKLKFAVLPSRKFFTITDVARLINPATGKRYVTQLSRWRILRGERTLYEKYGYTSLLLDKIRTISETTRWDEIKEEKIRGKLLTEVADSFLTPEGTAVFVPEQTISDCMKHVPYKDADTVVIPNFSPTLPSHTIVSMILTAFVNIGKLTSTELEDAWTLKINRTSVLWKSWDTRLQFLAFDPVMEGGRRRKKTPRRPKNRKTRRNWR